MAKETLTYDQMFQDFIRNNLSIRIDLRHEYGYGAAKRLEVSLVMYNPGTRIGEEIISTDFVSIIEGESKSSYWD